MKTYHILVVDDEAGNIQVLVQQLVESGKPYNVMGAINAQLAYSIAQTKQPDLIITDWDMPEMTGLELTQALKSNPETKFIPVLMVSGMRTRVEDLQQALEAGAVDFLRKPVNKIELWARVANTLQLSETHKLERQANEKLKALDQLKSHFFTNISHEFRTPLTIITGMAQQIKADPEMWLEKGNDLIIRNSQHLLSLVNQILDLRKLESGTLKLQLVQHNIIPYLQHLSDSFAALASSNGVKIHFLCSLEKLEMDFDPEKLLYILSNLLSNALKFTPKGGDIYVQVNYHQNTDAETLVIQVKDTGRGIPAEDLPHIFDRFYQVEDLEYQKKPGSGIGLSLVKELINLFNASIEVESKLNKGTNFILSFPITRTAPHKEVDVEGTSFLNQNQVFSSTIENSNSNADDLDDQEKITDTQSIPTLLIAEDNKDVQLYLKSFLETHYQLIFAENGQIGIDIALEEVPDIIISDVMMPIKDGFELCDTLKKDDRTSHIPIVMLTAKADFDSRITGLQKEADAYLTKPFYQEELLLILHNLLEIRRKLQMKYAADSINPTIDSSSGKNPKSNLEDAFLQKLHQITVTHMDNPELSTGFICKEMGMSKTNIFRKLKALTGLSLSHFIRNIRLRKAKEMLSDPFLNITDVAYAVGFSDPKYFSRIFSEIFQQSPSEFRNG